MSNLRSKYDFIVCGSGAAGLSGAVFAALKGWKVLLLEESQYVGGTSALSGGTTWTPLSSIGREVNDSDTLEEVTAFLDGTVGDASDAKVRASFLAHAATAVETLQSQTRMEFRPCPKHPDYMWDAGHATLNGRAIEPVPYKTGPMGKLRDWVRPPIEEFTVLGGMQVDRIDIRNLLDRYKSVKSFFYVGRLVATYVLDRIFYGRHSRYVMGQAMIARLLHSASELGVDIKVNASVTELVEDSGRVVGVKYSDNGGIQEAATERGVLLATGGFGANKERQSKYYEETCSGISPASADNKATLHPLAESLGAHYGSADKHPAFYAPCSTRTRKDGSTAVYPHFVFDRSKPGTICVNGDGQRFLNETISYHDFGRTVLGKKMGQEPIWLIGDQKAANKFGLGLLRPGGDNPKPLIKEGYLKSATTIEGLAEAIGVHAEKLAATVTKYNADAIRGEDPEFGRGSTPYQQHNGDPENAPNTTIRALEGPFFAVKLEIGVIGTAKGFSGNENGQLVKADGTVIEGLYAAGNDLQSIMGGVYPGPGITIGPGITFAYIATKHAAGELN